VIQPWQKDSDVCQVALRANDVARAQEHLSAAFECAPDRPLKLRLQQAELHCLCHDEDRAEDVLMQAAEAFPNNYWPTLKLAVLKFEQNDFIATRRYLTKSKARNRADTEPQICALDAEVWLLGGDVGDAAKGIGRLLLLRPEHPRLPAFLEHLFATKISGADGTKPLDVVAALKGKYDDRLLHSLHVQAALGVMDFALVRSLFKQNGPRCAVPQDARTLATALLGQGHYKTALRYLRFCVRRWPKAPGLIGLSFHTALRLGQYAMALQILDHGQSALPERQKLGNQLLLCGAANDLSGAIVAYETLRQAGQTTKQHRDIMSKLIFTQANLKDLDKIHARIGTPGREVGQVLHRDGVPGMMTLELQLEQDALAKGGGFASLKDWCAARPGSAMAAIRLIDHWAKTPHEPTGQAHPKRIFQYSHKAEPSADTAQMIASWSQVLGYEHQLVTKAEARVFLSKHFGPRWVQAFNITRSEEDAMGMIRLCLLAQYGGVWADSDTRLYGNLDTLLAGTGGLVVYRDTMGGALGGSFIAAPAKHPALIYAAKLVRQSLLQRSGDIIWNRTGPGVLTRAVGQYLSQWGTPDTQPQLTVLDGALVLCNMTLHNPHRALSPSSGKAGSPSVWDAVLKGLDVGEVHAG
jgi:tetratricopeptide (TPR) repeat protein